MPDDLVLSAIESIRQRNRGHADVNRLCDVLEEAYERARSEIAETDHLYACHGSVADFDGDIHKLLTSKPEGGADG